MNEPHLRSATAAGIVPAVAVDRLKRQEENVTKVRITDRLPKGVSVGSAFIARALTMESPSLHPSFSGSSSVAVARTERVQSRQIAGPLFLRPRSIPAGLSPGSRSRYLVTGN